jgi:hypothetical protein
MEREMKVQGRPGLGAFEHYGFSDHISRVYIKNKVTLFLNSLFQALVTLFERHLEKTQKVQWQPASWGPPLNLLVALQMSLKWSYGSLKVGLQKQSFFVYELHG